MTAPRPGPPPGDTELLPGLRAGEDEAFEAFVRRFCDPMYYVARRILRNEDDTRDAVQEAFLNAFRGLPQFDGQAQLKTWLHRIVINTALMKLRARERRPERPIEDLLPHFGEGEHHLQEPSDFASPVEEILNRRELRLLIQDRIDELPESYRTIVLLRDIEGLDTAETACLLKTSEAVVRTRLHRARQALRTLLEPHLREVNFELS